MTLPTAFIITLVAALLAFLYQVYLAYIKEEIAQINDLIVAADRIERLAIDYWLAQGKDDAFEEIVAAAQLRGALAVTDSFESTVEKLLLHRFKNYQELDGALFDAATGGTFEKPGRLPDPERAVSVMRLCHEVRALLRSQRPRLYWAH